MYIVDVCSMRRSGPSRKARDSSRWEYTEIREKILKSENNEEYLYLSSHIRSESSDAIQDKVDRVSQCHHLP